MSNPRTNILKTIIDKLKNSTLNETDAKEIKEMLEKDLNSKSTSSSGGSKKKKINKKSKK